MLLNQIINQGTILKCLLNNLKQKSLLLEQPSRGLFKRGLYVNLLIEKPKIGVGKSFRRIVHFPEEYTVQPLNTTNLGGRDPVSGRIVVKGIGGGIKHKYHWVKFHRDGPSTDSPQVERVIDVIFDGCRTAKVALVATGNEVKYILASENMKPGDIIKTSSTIPRIPVRANEGDAYPLGALPVGTIVHCVEKYPSYPVHYCTAAGTFATIQRKFEEFVVILLPSKRELALRQECMATVGRVSNVGHNKEHIGSPQNNRALGNRPRSGLWQRKSGRHGRKLKKPPPMRIVPAPVTKSNIPIKFTFAL